MLLIRNKTGYLASAFNAHLGMNRSVYTDKLSVIYITKYVALITNRDVDCYKNYNNSADNFLKFSYYLYMSYILGLLHLKEYR